MYVECEKTGEGIRVVFSYFEGREEAFDIRHPKDISTVLRLMSYPVSAEALMVEVRNMAGITVH